VVISIPQGKRWEGGSLPDMQGAWIILKPIKAYLQLVQSGHLVSGTYCNAEVEGSMEGTLFKEGEDIIFIGKWEDQLGGGDYRVSIRNCEKSEAGRTFFQGNWKHSQSRVWDGEFLGEMR
jgi:hypothetical protein